MKKKLKKNLKFRSEETYHFVFQGRRRERKNGKGVKGKGRQEKKRGGKGKRGKSKNI
jgi:hypothetical protein